METTTINLTWAEFYAIVGGGAVLYALFVAWLWRLVQRREAAEAAQREAEEKGEDQWECS
jgi:hypothetical protein